MVVPHRPKLTCGGCRELQAKTDELEREVKQLRQENAYLRGRVSELLHANNRELERRRVSQETIKLIRDVVNTIAEVEKTGVTECLVDSQKG